MRMLPTLCFGTVLMLAQKGPPIRPDRIDWGWGESQKGPDREMSQYYDAGTQWRSLPVRWDDSQAQKLVQEVYSQFRGARHSVSGLKKYQSLYKKAPSRTSAFAMALAVECFDSPSGLVQPTYRRATSDLTLGATEFTIFASYLKSSISPEELNVILRMHCQFCWNPKLWFETAQKLQQHKALQTSTLCAVAQRIFVAYELTGNELGVLYFADLVSDAIKPTSQSRLNFALGNAKIAKGRLTKRLTLFDDGASVLRAARRDLLDTGDPYDFWYVKSDPGFETLLASRRRQWFTP